jgi:hypothetical protein
VHLLRTISGARGRKDFYFGPILRNWPPKVVIWTPTHFFAFQGCSRSWKKTIQTKFDVACRYEIHSFYRVHLSRPVLEILIFLGFFQIFANFDALDTSNGRNSVIYGPIWEILAVLERARRGESRRSVRRATPLTQSVKEFICDSADGFFSLLP